MTFTRRHLLAGASALALPTLPVVDAFAQKALFALKYGNNLPITHPMNTRAKEMATKINAESKGRLDFQVYPNNQLGNDTDMLSQVRSGALDFFTLSPLILGTLVPAAQISGVGFAFKDYNQIWAAMDGDLGAHVRKQIAASSSLFAFEKIWDNGYRQITSGIKPITTPDDLKGLKIRTPPSPFWVSMFKAFEASPATTVPPVNWPCPAVAAQPRATTRLPAARSLRAAAVTGRTGRVAFMEWSEETYKSD